jgi:nucleoside-triphosphatase
MSGVVVSVIVITGDIGAGKTTLLKKVIEKSKRDFYGVISERFDDGYYVEDIKTGKKKILCSKECIGFKFRKFYFDPAAFQVIIDSMKGPGEILVYDEIGYLEVEEQLHIWDYMREPAIVVVRKDLVNTISSRFTVEVFDLSQDDTAKVEDMILERIKAW